MLLRPCIVVSSSHQDNSELINLMVVSQREHLCDSLSAYFREAPVSQIADDAVNRLEQVTEKLAQLHPNLLLVDLALSDPVITEWLHTIRKQDAKVKIILLYDDGIPDLLNEIVQFSISGLIKTTASCELYRKAICTVHNGELWLPHLLMSQIIDHLSKQHHRLSGNNESDLPRIISNPVLTPRELYVIELIAEGLTNKQIAKQLSISPETVKKKLTIMFDKSGVHTRSQLVLIYATFLKNSSQSH